MTWLTIDRSQKTPLIRQIYKQLRTKILSGELSGGYRLPSTRQLAEELEVSRNVVLEAYDQLLAEGFLEGKQGAGTFVAEGAFLKKTNTIPSYMLEENSSMKNKNIIDFRSGIPSLDQFPRKQWGQLAKRVSLETDHSLFGYDSPEGRIELRTVLSDYLLRTRGVECHPDQLVITTGATQAMTLIAKLLISANDKVIIEDPITHEIQTIFQSYGASLHPIRVDENGMDTNQISHEIKPAFIFVTPSHQFPIGGTLPIQRRIQLIEYARKVDSYIVEDDYDSEFRYEGPSISSLQGLDPNRTIYIGTFSKILSPALRLGYLILPPALVERGRTLKYFSDLHTPSLEQLTLALFIKEGHLEKHIFRMKKFYRKRRNFLKEQLYNEFGDNVNIHGDSTGLHLVAEFEGVHFTDNLLSELHDHGIKLYPVELHTINKGLYSNHLILGFGNLDEVKLAKGVTKLKRVLLKYQKVTQ
ncbi:MocR-like pyridoxine biosynthesis transcription factor PdxR [Heyndrickxia sporothermodurans]|uniref:PLP-dependent aminotransferase family protein n=1 Tax=Heyndrickxia sporothermodurans TaxID=46224 RepID=A0AB37HIC2_9BACI|nr:PLP-dependent aminotransferase family protein [Heyndrickxia sporothermodurans]MBL5768760.1 PLP-dependent aminotransferase family protein [Heyndrickxia sporothermodurans]MBL5772486.1 PLP-dependent aminotransferase family protein [Heyndrickxia sporothermodurans]MBL5776001.1 PLP-dependent aminotransferase family protein [Heyndrickxia sporothermodurans]MBL5779523.1 PLP-dependent aminotransferase family protein [Heyndrickxia sporothermodurans]MBL5782677.1 PLP-dependent aminotransferase family pr